MLAISFRMDSSKLLEPYLDDLEAIVNDSSNPLKEEALFILGSTYPTILPKAISYLTAHLEDRNNSAQQTITIADSLLKALPNDPSIVHRVLKAVNVGSNKSVKIGVLQQLGLSRTSNSEALDFIGASLGSDDADVRQTAINATGRLFPVVRERFTSQLTRIATDSKETPKDRSDAESVLKQ